MNVCIRDVVVRIYCKSKTSTTVMRCSLVSRMRYPLYLGYDMYPSISVQDAILAELPGLMKKFVSEPWRSRFPMVCLQVYTLYIHCTVHISDKAIQYSDTRTIIHFSLRRND